MKTWGRHIYCNYTQCSAYKKLFSGVGKLGDAEEEVVAGRGHPAHRHRQAGQPGHDKVNMVVMINKADFCENPASID